MARAKHRLDKGRTTFLDDSTGHSDPSEGKRAGGKPAQNALALISDYGMEDDEEDIQPEHSTHTGDGNSLQKALGSEDPLASFLDELQHEGLLEEGQQASTAAGMYVS